MSRACDRVNGVQNEFSSGKSNADASIVRAISASSEPAEQDLPVAARRLVVAAQLGDDPGHDLAVAAQHPDDRGVLAGPRAHRRGGASSSARARRRHDVQRHGRRRRRPRRSRRPPGTRRRPRGPRRTPRRRPPPRSARRRPRPRGARDSGRSPPRPCGASRPRPRRPASRWLIRLISVSQSRAAASMSSREPPADRATRNACWAASFASRTSAGIGGRGLGLGAADVVVVGALVQAERLERGLRTLASPRRDGASLIGDPSLIGAGVVGAPARRIPRPTPSRLQRRRRPLALRRPPARPRRSRWREHATRRGRSRRPRRRGPGRRRYRPARCAPSSSPWRRRGRGRGRAQGRDHRIGLALDRDADRGLAAAAFATVPPAAARGASVNGGSGGAGWNGRSLVAGPGRSGSARPSHRGRSDRRVAGSGELVVRWQVAIDPAPIGRPATGRSAVDGLRLGERGGASRDRVWSDGDPDSRGSPGAWNGGPR